MSGYTPGPWDATFAGVVSRAAISANVVCEAPIHYLESSENWSANANIIAAAPELLEALEFLVDVYRDDVEQYPHGEEHIRRAMAVIAKAKGEQP